MFGSVWFERFTFTPLVTRLLSHYQRSPESLSLPPEGPNSGYLVIQDEESETRTTCFGLCKDQFLMDLPFTQDKSLTIGDSDNSYNANFIPVLNQPLSSNRYYAIKYRGSHIGEAYACSREMTPSLVGKRPKDVDPRPLDPNDVYQQFEIFPYDAGCISGGAFCAKSVAPDGFLPYFLRSFVWWQAYTYGREIYRLGEAQGINDSLRARLPDFNSPTIVGKWYCPFMFVKDGNLKDQVKRSFYYEMTLEQRWEKIFACENNFSSQRNSVSVEADIQREVVFVGGREAVWDGNTNGDGVVWFRNSDGGEQVNVGLSSLIVDRMKWEEERVGWVREEKRQVKVNRTEEFGGFGGVWSKFDCYVLVERFVLKRMDGSVVLTYDFKHTHAIRSKWE